jgi:hypothetical protein
MLEWLRRLEKGPEVSPQLAVPGAGPERPVGFGYGCAWIAVTGVPPEQVVAALGLREVRRAGWHGGVEAAEGDRVFVTPAVRGWVLATSRFALAPAEGRAAWVAALSARLGVPVQAFVTDRVPEWHGWVLARDGQVVRSYGYHGDRSETLENAGRPTPEERALRQAFFDERSPEARLPGYFERHDLRHPDEEDVLDLAARWGLDPRTLEDVEEPSGPGWLGRLEGRR